MFSLRQLVQHVTWNVTTLAREIQAQEVITLRYLRLPEFDKNRQIVEQKYLAFDNDYVKHDIILGTNFLSKARIKLNHSEGKMELFDSSNTLHPPGRSELHGLWCHRFIFFIQTDDKLLGKDWLHCYVTKILDTKYEWTAVTDVIDNLTHINLHQAADLLKVVQKAARCLMVYLAPIHITMYTLNSYLM